MRPQAADVGHGNPSARGPDSAAAFLGQLYAPAYVADVRPRVAAERVRPPSGGHEPRVAAERARPPSGGHEPRVAAELAAPEAHPGHEPLPAVLLVSRACDGEFAAVANLLGRVGLRTVRINADQVAEADLVVDPVRGTVRVDGRWFAPTVAWLRHFSAQAIPGGGGRAHDMFLRESWSAAAAELAGVAATSIRSQRPATLDQLRLAERHGIAVPRTVLTTDPNRAAEQLPGPRLIIKAAGRHFVEAAPGSLTGVFPAIVERREPAPLPWPGPPVVVQEYVEHDAELRVYYVAGEVRGFQIVKDTPADIWLHSDRVQVHSVDLPPSVVRAARVLAGSLSLRYCAFDFLVRNDEPVFLELDPAGDWRWIESKAGAASITMAVARMLSDLHWSAGHGSFDLLTFLTGPGAATA